MVLIIMSLMFLGASIAADKIPLRVNGVVAHPDGVEYKEQLLLYRVLMAFGGCGCFVGAMFLIRKRTEE
ncbi:MAG: hypothetical protein WCO77_04000 [bacterium]